MKAFHLATIEGKNELKVIESHLKQLDTLLLETRLEIRPKDRMMYISTLDQSKASHFSAIWKEEMFSFFVGTKDLEKSEIGLNFQIREFYKLLNKTKPSELQFMRDVDNLIIISKGAITASLVLKKPTRSIESMKKPVVPCEVVFDVDPEHLRTALKTFHDLQQRGWSDFRYSQFSWEKKHPDTLRIKDPDSGYELEFEIPISNVEHSAAKISTKYVPNRIYDSRWTWQKGEMLTCAFSSSRPIQITHKDEKKEWLFTLAPIVSKEEQRDRDDLKEMKKKAVYIDRRERK